MLKSPLQSPFFSAKDALREAVSGLQRAGIGTASLDARLLLEHVLGVSREQLLADGEMPMMPRQEARYRELIEKRAQRQPVSQLTGRREFWGLNFKVTAATLDPRPDSETLIEAVLERRTDRDAALAILDLGTGTGCLLLSLLKEYANARGTGVDMSEDALNVARENAINLKLEPRARFLRSDWGAQAGGRFDIIVANPPYIPAAAIDALAPEVSLFEPRSALDGGQDGLDCYRAILPQLPGLLADGGMAALEIGMGQEEEIERLSAENGLKVAGIRRDLSGVARCVVIQSHHFNH